MPRIAYRSLSMRKLGGAKMSQAGRRATLRPQVFGASHIPLP